MQTARAKEGILPAQNSSAAVRRLINQANKGAQALISTAYRNARHNANHGTFAEGNAHLRANHHTKVFTVKYFIKLHANKITAIGYHIVNVGVNFVAIVPVGMIKMARDARPGINKRMPTGAPAFGRDKKRIEQHPFKGIAGRNMIEIGEFPFYNTAYGQRSL